MICHFKDGEGMIHDITIESVYTVGDVKKAIENIMLREEIVNNNNDDDKSIKICSNETNDKDSQYSSTKTQFSSCMKPSSRNQMKRVNNKQNSSPDHSKDINDSDDEFFDINNSDNTNISYTVSKKSLGLFKYRRDLFKIQYKMYTLYNEQKINELGVKEGDLFIITPLPTLKIYFMLPINSTKYFNCIFKPKFLEMQSSDDSDDENDSENNLNNSNRQIKMEKLKVGVHWMKKTGWTIGPIAIPRMADCAMTLLNALEAVFSVKNTNIKIFDGSWNEIRTLSTINPINKENLIFGLYIRNQIEEIKIHPNKNLTAWTNVFKYKYYNLPTKSKSRQLLNSQSNSKLPVLIAQPIPQEMSHTEIDNKNSDFSTFNNQIPLVRSKSEALKGSQIKLRKSPSADFQLNNADSSKSKRNLQKNKIPSDFYHPVPVFFSYDCNKKVLACYNSDENLCVQLVEIKKDLGIPESTKISIEFNSNIINLNRNPEDLKIIEFSTMKIVSSDSCILI